MIDVLALAQALLRAESVTPARGAVFNVLEAALVSMGFAVDRFVVGAAPDGPVENMIALRSGAARHLAFAGHVDVVPPGTGWDGSPWSGEVRGDLLYGRGAVDMKGAVAAFVAAASRAAGPTLSLLITGDEEGPATFGTPALIERMAARGIAPDLCLVGEPTSVRQLGDMVKIGRRGSVNIWIVVPGRQGHVAYPHLADNPAGKLAKALAELENMALDEGNAWFQPSNLEITDIAIGNPAHNVIPARAEARINIRFNDEQRGDALIDRVTEVVRIYAPEATVTGKVSGEAFLTEPGAWTALVSAAIEARTGLVAELSTSGGTSDARFLSKLCPTLEFGLLNATMHQVDEAVAVADLETLTAIYADVIARLSS
ncbi:succinyl-diaminopimelate desuccinylase [Sphingomonas sp. RP10(2022)]|uniref:Succinyl-diaminopimelate desuccinylase n=1 Tax=Sphingomonas liriopis TaxID=2949094 RepID=A0A9X2HXK9_9SPHN|nr:succinyl-diaminopimelate desuccinylase [Sphingomonas liriopis]MCP3735289.1 succinyl-diaminopimelate desuccinylase [Sphingomonas liriopis]